MAQVPTMSHRLFMVGIGRDVEKVNEVIMRIFFVVEVHFLKILQKGCRYLHI